MACLSYSVVFDAECKLGLNFRISDAHALEVFNFTRPEGEGWISPAEACGRIQPGDVLMGVNSINFESYHIEEQLAILGILQHHGPELPERRHVILHFLRKPYSDALRRHQVRRENAMLADQYGPKLLHPRSHSAGASLMRGRKPGPKPKDGGGAGAGGRKGGEQHSAPPGPRKGGAATKPADGAVDGVKRASKKHKGSDAKLAKRSSSAADGAGGSDSDNSGEGEQLYMLYDDDGNTIGRGGGRRRGRGRGRPSRAGDTRDDDFTLKRTRRPGGSGGGRWGTPARITRRPIITIRGGSYEAPQWSHADAEDEFRRYVDAKRAGLRSLAELDNKLLQQQPPSGAAETAAAAPTDAGMASASAAGSNDNASSDASSSSAMAIDTGEAASASEAPAATVAASAAPVASPSAESAHALIKPEPEASSAPSTSAALPATVAAVSQPAPPVADGGAPAASGSSSGSMASVAEAHPRSRAAVGASSASSSSSAHGTSTLMSPSGSGGGGVSKSELSRRIGINPSNYISWVSGRLSLRPSCGQILRTWVWLQNAKLTDEGECWKQ